MMTQTEPGMTKMNENDYTVEHVTWASQAQALSGIRHRVFVEEQKVPAELEWDDADERCEHVLARANDGTPIGTGRLLPDGHIGRMAVLPQWRGRGIGSALLETLIEIALARGDGEIILHAQTAAMDFYRRHGFREQGEEFLEANIPHHIMVRRLGGG